LVLPAVSTIPACLWCVRFWIFVFFSLRSCSHKPATVRYRFWTAGTAPFLRCRFSRSLPAVLPVSTFCSAAGHGFRSPRSYRTGLPAPAPAAAVAVSFTVSCCCVHRSGCGAYMVYIPPFCLPALLLYRYLCGSCHCRWIAWVRSAWSTVFCLCFVRGSLRSAPPACWVGFLRLRF